MSEKVINDPRFKETDCRHTHHTIREAIRCARLKLGAISLNDMTPRDLTRYQGTTDATKNKFVGFQINTRQRWRLDWAEFKNPAGKRGVHVNEEDFTRIPSQQKVAHWVEDGTTDAMYRAMRLYWNKWTSGGDLVEK